MKDVVYVEHKNFISVKEHSLSFKNLINKTIKYIPIDDISMVIFDNIDSYFSNQVVNVCVNNDIGMIFCGINHSPIADISSTYCHRKKLERIKSQLSVSYKTKQRLWKKIISAKIINQSECLIAQTNDKIKFNELVITSKEVKEGDIDNREAYAALIYFDCLFGKDFKRGRYQDKINAALNYGYALIRAVIRKELAIAGFEMSIGIFHRSSENPFNLSDDVIEPFRPFIDSIVYEEMIINNAPSFDREQRINLMKIFIEKCIIDNKVYSINDAIKCCVISLIECLENDSAKHLKLPSFIELRK